MFLLTTPASALHGATREAPTPDPMAQPHVDARAAGVGGVVRLTSASGPMEALWIRIVDDDGNAVAFDRATGQHLAASVRLTPSDARELAALLTRYADTHEDSDGGDE